MKQLIVVISLVSLVGAACGVATDQVPTSGAVQPTATRFSEVSSIAVTAVPSPEPIATEAVEPTVAVPAEDQLARINRLLYKIAETGGQTSGDLILANASHFEIRWLIYNREFMVRVKVGPFDKVKGEAEQWFLRQGFIRDESVNDLCFLRVSFVASAEVAPDFAIEDSVPNGCPVPVVVPIVPPQ